jgi:hypothetical protein
VSRLETEFAPLLERAVVPLLIERERWADAGRVYADPVAFVRQHHEIIGQLAERRPPSMADAEVRSSFGALHPRVWRSFRSRDGGGSWRAVDTGESLRRSSCAAGRCSMVADPAVSGRVYIGNSGVVQIDTGR